MDKSRYRYSRVQGKQEIHRLITPSDLKMIHSIDREFLEEILVTQKPLKTDVGGWHGRCPFCDGPRKRRKSQDSYRPAYIRPREQGYVFHCWSCDTILTTYKLIERVFGEEKAQEYALRRWEAGELCGGGWNCPLPESVRERLLDAKEQRREAYRHAEHERKAFNYQKKYGSSSH